MRYLNLFAISFLGALLASCGSESGKNGSAETQEVHDQPVVENSSCKWQYTEAPCEVKWTAYKYTEKTGVSGTFDNVEITPMQTIGNLNEILQDMDFRIPIAGTNSNQPDRDMKIKNIFFGMMTSTEFITGKIQAVDGDANHGNMSIVLTMNNMPVPVEGSYSLSDNGELVIKADLNLLQWNAEKSIEALNAECKDLHKGADGVSKLWPDVSVVVTTKLTSDCQ